MLLGRVLQAQRFVGQSPNFIGHKLQQGRSLSNRPCAGFNRSTMIPIWIAPSPAGYIFTALLRLSETELIENLR